MSLLQWLEVGWQQQCSEQPTSPSYQLVATTSRPPLQQNLQKKDRERERERGGERKAFFVQVPFTN